MYAQLGEIRFQALKGFSGLSDKKEALYAEHALIDGKPRLQRTGNALDEFSLNIKLHVAFCDPEAEYDALNKYRDDGEILPLIYGTGYFEGSFVITSLSRTVNDTSDKGEYIDIDVSISLKEFYQPDQMQANQKRALLNAFAVSSDRPTPENIPVPPLTPDAVALKAIREVNLAKMNVLNKINSVQSAINAPATLLLQAQAFATDAVETSQNLAKSASSMAVGLSQVSGILTSFPSLLSVAPDLQTKINDVLAQKVSFDSCVASFIGLPSVTTDLQAQYVLDLFNQTTLSFTVLQDKIKAMNEKCSPLIVLKSRRKTF